MQCIASALADSVVPMPLWPWPWLCSLARACACCMASAICAVQPNTAHGTPPAIGLPSVRKSGSRFHARVQPPGPVEIVCVSSMISSVPWRRVSSRAVPA